MTISNNFNEEIRKYSGKNYFTILYDGYKKVLILFDELEKKQYDLYDLEQYDVDKVVLEKMKELVKER